MVALLPLFQAGRQSMVALRAPVQVGCQEMTRPHTKFLHTHSCLQELRICSFLSVLWLTSGDVQSQVICEVTHITLHRGSSLRGTASLAETIRVPPTLEVSQIPTMGNQVNLICQVKKFYPRNLQLTWLENGNLSRTEMTSLLLENKDGTFNQTSWLLVNSSAHQENVVFTCQVEHDGQLSLTKSHTLDSNESGISFALLEQNAVRRKRRR
ncbi:tyrosine-protein phosphatase non-receptor type substrate 1-like [Sorex araneus]|uniref:tyrosine-protein phosphatase non-receptor type substrate 1-like n=1 Tax=Sorex araneus TaxID=42254 RepID=UPI00243390C1|nr:tyrosine-protein phosphatase non-receptor type substrate 1-like [Sorex araneus]